MVCGEIERGGFQVKSSRVQTAAEFQAKIKDNVWDIILADYALPNFTGLQALALLKKTGHDIPFILVSGNIGETVAVEVMRAGAADYIMKHELARLAPAIQRELREAKFRGERRELENQMKVNERMVSVGMLASGIAHEINNPLTYVMGALEMAAHECAMLPNSLGEPKGKTEGMIRRARQGADRIQNLVRDIKMFSRQEERPIMPIDPRKVLTSILSLSSYEFRHRARVKTTFSDVPMVKADGAKLGQAFLNLVVNAAQALPENQADSHEIRITTKTDSLGRAVIEFTDTGCGIPIHLQERIFEPFYTTKLGAEGSGLGLSLCRSIVRSFGGEIQVESDHGRGATFRVILPAAGQATPVPQTPNPQDIDVTPLPKAEAQAKVLIIDDEAEIIDLLCNALSEHEVHSARGGKEALGILEKVANFDIVLCDLMMGDMGGAELFEIVQKTKPELASRFVFITGGACAPKAREFLKSTQNHVIEKPFNLRVLRTLVHQRIAAGKK